VRKKVKSFTLDEEIYNSLMAKFKEHKVEGSLSLFVHNSMKELLEYITGIKEELEIKKSAYNVPLSFVIDEVVKNPLLIGHTQSLEFRDQNSSDGSGYLSKYEIDVEEWNDKYEAQKMKVSVEFYVFLKTNLYDLSPNGKYLVNRETGKKYIPVDRTRLVEIDIV